MADEWDRELTWLDCLSLQAAVGEVPAVNEAYAAAYGEWRLTAPPDAKFLTWDEFLLTGKTAQLLDQWWQELTPAAKLPYVEAACNQIYDQWDWLMTKAQRLRSAGRTRR